MSTFGCAVISFRGICWCFSLNNAFAVQCILKQYLRILLHYFKGSIQNSWILMSSHDDVDLVTRMLFAECSRCLGVSEGAITYKQLTSSPSAHDYSRPRYGRLNMALGYGAWRPAIQDKNQYLQVQKIVVKMRAQ